MSVPFTLVLDGAAIATEADFHEAIRQQTGIAWYGGNLDALDEMIAFIIPERWGVFRIEWRDVDLSILHDPQRRLMIIGCLKEGEERFSDRFLGLSLTFSQQYFDEGQDPWERKV